MALIDVLPKFRYKPLELDAITPTRLVPKPVSVEHVKPPVLSPDNKSTLAPLPAQPITRQPNSVMKDSANIKLSKAYSGMQPLADTLNTSTQMGNKAKLAIISQMGLENGWTTIPADFNYGNITTGNKWKGASTVKGDHDAQGNAITQNFRGYKSTQEFVDNYLDLLKKEYPIAYQELHSPNFSIDTFTDALVGGERKYAQDPTYKQKVKGIYTSVVTNNETN